jgi:hypothetical protein
MAAKMSEKGTEIVKLTSVPLTREKQVQLTAELDKYAAATNLVIASALKYHLASKTKVYHALRDIIERKYLLGIEKTDDESVIQEARIRFANRCSEDVLNAVLGIQAKTGRRADEILLDYTTKYTDQYVRDVVKSAFSEVVRHRKLAKVIRGLQDKTPYFRKGRLITSKPLHAVTEKALVLYSTIGEEIVIPFDKRSRSQEAARLEAISKERRKTGRVRLTRQEAGYLDIATF